jgi:hypothetical protein
MRQGPHHGAQKSTRTGMSLRVMCFSKLSVLSSTGCAVNSGFLQLPQLGCALSLSDGMRFTASQ